MGVTDCALYRNDVTSNNLNCVKDVQRTGTCAGRVRAQSYCQRCYCHNCCVSVCYDDSKLRRTINVSIDCQIAKSRSSINDYTSLNTLTIGGSCTNTTKCCSKTD